MDQVRTVVEDRSGATFENISDQNVIQIAEYINQSKIYVNVCM